MKLSRNIVDFFSTQKGSIGQTVYSKWHLSINIYLHINSKCCLNLHLCYHSSYSNVAHLMACEKRFDEIDWMLKLELFKSIWTEKIAAQIFYWIHKPPNEVAMNLYFKNSKFYASRSISNVHNAIIFRIYFCPLKIVNFLFVLCTMLKMP